MNIAFYKNRKSIEALLIFFLMFMSLINIHAQKEKKLLRKGNRLYEDNKYNEAEIKYRKANEAEKSTYKSNFNIGTALYKQEKYEEAAKEFSSVTAGIHTKDDLAKAYHNLGNTFVNMKKFEEAVEAYKHALRNVPGDVETKYNLAYAQAKLKQQQQQQQQENKENKEQEEGQEDKKDQNKNKQEEQEQQNKEEQQRKEEQQKQGDPRKISKEDAERMLQAIQEREKQIQEKIKKENARTKTVETDIDW